MKTDKTIVEIGVVRVDEGLPEGAGILWPEYDLAVHDTVMACEACGKTLDRTVRCLVMMVDNTVDQNGKAMRFHRLCDRCGDEMVKLWGGTTKKKRNI